MNYTYKTVAYIKLENKKFGHLYNTEITRKLLEKKKINLFKLLVLDVDSLPLSLFPNLASKKSQFFSDLPRTFSIKY